MFDRFKRKERMELVFLKKTGVKYSTIDMKTAKIEDKTLSYNGKTFVIPKEPSLILKGKNYVFLEFDTEKLIAFNELELGYDAVWLDQLVFQKLIAQLVARIRSEMQPMDKSKILTYVLLLGFGVLIGYVIATSINANAKMILETVKCL